MSMYNVQCLCGHVSYAPPGSELEKRCRDHAAAGFLDALVLHPDECEECQHDQEMRDQRIDAAMADWPSEAC